jgi:hypothetical protein
VQYHRKDAIYLHKDEALYRVKDGVGSFQPMKQLTEYKTGYDGRQSLLRELFHQDSIGQT